MRCHYYVCVVTEKEKKGKHKYSKKGGKSQKNVLPLGNKNDSIIISGCIWIYEIHIVTILYIYIYIYAFANRRKTGRNMKSKQKLGRQDQVWLVQNRKDSSSRFFSSFLYICCSTTQFNSAELFYSSQRRMSSVLTVSSPLTTK